MSTILLAILPIFLLILLGWLLRVRLFVAPEAWQPMERITYFIFFPALLIVSVAGGELPAAEALPMVAALAAPLLAMSLISILIGKMIGLEGPAISSLQQGAIRQNTYLGLAIAQGVFGPAGLAFAAVAIALIVPLVNVLSVAALIRYGSGERGLGPALGQLLRNPMLLAPLLGLFLNLSGLGLPPVVGEVLRILGSAALPLGLLAMGAGLDLGAARRSGMPVGVAILLKLLVMPLLTATACLLLGLEGTAALVVVLFNGLPTAPSAYILARQLGGDATLMASIITLQLGCSLLSLPLLLHFAGKALA